MKKPTRKDVKHAAIATGFMGGIVLSTYGALYLNSQYFNAKSAAAKYAYLIALMHERNPEFVEEMMGVANANIEAALAPINK